MRSLAVCRRASREVKVGDLVIGGNAPICVQSMLTSPTTDVSQVIAEMQRLQTAGCQLVRITIPTRRDLKALPLIRKKMNGITMPIAADIHFNPALALNCTQWVEKVRINPGNFVDQKRFQLREYTNSQYKEELQRVQITFQPLLEKLQQSQRALRIGVNHGSLSDRILNRWGDTPKGMVQCAMEYLLICQKNNFKSVIVSMKSSNPLVAVAAYRLLAKDMIAKNMDFPLHLGVTEAGDGLQARCKSALGIGTLLADGLGDTIRVSLTEPSENEIPVANAIIQAVHSVSQGPHWKNVPWLPPTTFQRRKTRSIQLGKLSLGYQNPVALLAQTSSSQTSSSQTSASQTSASPTHFSLPSFHKQEVFDAHIANCTSLQSPSPLLAKPPLPRLYPFSLAPELASLNYPLCLLISPDDWQNLPYLLENLKHQPHRGMLVLDAPYCLQPARRLILYLQELGLDWLIAARLPQLAPKDTSIQTAVEVGALAVDGYLDAIICPNDNPQSPESVFCQTLMQAARLKTFQTDYISCPSCGRTLFDLQLTTASIKAKTAHLKGLKIGIMGCIVNGPGEMADADFGYVGGAPGKINLYKGQQCVEKGVPAEQAVTRLVELIKTHGAWKEPK